MITPGLRADPKGCSRPVPKGSHLPDPLAATGQEMGGHQ